MWVTVVVDRVALVPQPPLVVPQLTAGGARESVRLREACLAAVARLGAGADRWLVLGADAEGRRTVNGSAYGTFRGYGVDVRVSLSPGSPVRTGDPTADLPLPVLIAGWLRGHGAAHASATAELVDPALGTGDCRRLGEELAGRVPPGVGVLVVGDGAITHTERAPGHLDQRAGPFDAAVARALSDGDPDRLLALDPELAEELGAVGRAPWQVLAGLALADGHDWDAELLYSDAPFGVGYHVAFWERIE